MRNNYTKTERTFYATTAVETKNASTHKWISGSNRTDKYHYCIYGKSVFLLCVCRNSKQNQGKKLLANAIEECHYWNLKLVLILPYFNFTFTMKTVKKLLTL